jgi:hypothetical protein
MVLEDEKVNKLREAVQLQARELASVAARTLEYSSFTRHLTIALLRSVYAQLYSIISFESLYFGLEELILGRLSQRVIPVSAIEHTISNILAALAEKKL